MRIVQPSTVRMKSAANILTQLHARADPANLAGMARFGIAIENRLGVAVPEMRRIAKAVGNDHRLALALWKTGIAEARIVASMIAVPAQLTETSMEAWVKDFNSWDVCDQVCMNVFDKTPLAGRKIVEWAARKDEFVKRAAFALLAALASHDKAAADGTFVRLLPVIKRGTTFLEHLLLSDLSRDRCHEGLFVVGAMPVVGASGSPVNPVVIG
ncbi:MAG: DNA alkylation repair protein [Candidatus Binatia bacterium]